MLPELLTRARQANQYIVGDHIRALAAAHDSRTREFFVGVLKSGEGCRLGDPAGPYSLECRIDAAVGLAELGDPAGVEWLIQNCEQGVWVSQRELAPASAGSALGMVCLKALQHLSGRNDVDWKTSAEWQVWWQGAKASFTPAHP